MKPIQPDKQYEYQQGGRARILCVDGHTESHPVISMDDKGQCFSHTSEGVGHAENRNLIEVVPVWEGEIYIHANGSIRNTSYFSPAEIARLSDGRHFDWRKIKVKQVEYPT